MQTDFPETGADALAQLRHLSLHVQNAVEAERLALAREVHDELGAALTGIRLQLEALAVQLQAGVAVPPVALLALAETTRNTQLAARDICGRLRPVLLEDMGLVQACRWYVKDWSARVGIAAQLRVGRLPVQPQGGLATDMFRVMQELLTNVARHAGASQVQVRLSGSNSALCLRVQDDGHGFLLERAVSGFGILRMRERVRQHGGSLEVQSAASGSRFTARMLFARP
jgi:two-component system, NarL family, sensor histidine kinase UhpB